MASIRRNDSLVLPSGTRFQVAGRLSEDWLSLSTGVLAVATLDEGAVNVGGGLVRAPRGLYVRILQTAYDSAGGEHAAGATLYVDPESPVQPVVKMANGNVYPVAGASGRSGAGAAVGLSLLVGSVAAVAGMGR